MIGRECFAALGAAWHRVNWALSHQLRGRKTHGEEKKPEFLDAGASDHGRKSTGDTGGRDEDEDIENREKNGGLGSERREIGK